VHSKDDNKIPYTTVPNEVLRNSTTNNEQRVLFDVWIEIFKQKRKSKKYPKEWQVTCY